MQYKRPVVQESFAPGASIASVALAHGINANLLHNWRWQYRRGDFGPITQEPLLLPVRVHSNVVTPAALAAEPAKLIDAPGGARAGEIELIFSAARVVLRGTPDPVTLRGIIAALRT